MAKADKVAARKSEKVVDARESKTQSAKKSLAKQTPNTFVPAPKSKSGAHED